MCQYRLRGWGLLSAPGLYGKTGQGLAGRRFRHCRLVRLLQSTAKVSGEAPRASSAGYRSPQPFSITEPTSQSISKSQHDGPTATDCGSAQQGVVRTPGEF